MCKSIFYNKFNSWLEWFCNYKEEKPNLKGNSFSPILCISGLCFYCLRRLSIIENIRHFIYYEKGSQKFVTPAKFIDFCLILELFFIIFMTYYASVIKSNYYTYGIVIVLWLCIQTLQTNIFHLIWKAVVSEEIHRESHNLVRNLFISIYSYFKISFLFGLLYWWGFSESFQNINTCNLWDCIYFSVVTATTLGYGDIIPKSGDAGNTLKLMIIIEVIFTMCMFGIVVSRALSLIKPITD